MELSNIRMLIPLKDYFGHEQSSIQINYSDFLRDYYDRGLIDG